MCGIAGLKSLQYRELGPLLEEMLASMQHRGPDGAGFVIDGVCQRRPHLSDLELKGKRGTTALGHVRLAITGSGEGLQPFQSDDSKLSLLHNGEIYNYRTLAAGLEHDLSKATGSDSEVLLHMISEDYSGDLGKTMRRVLPKLDGVYAIAVSDGRKTIIARDKIGVRQLYYYSVSGLVAFASEKKPLMALGGKNVDIRRLLPGHMMGIEGDSIVIESFWKPAMIRRPVSISDPQKAIVEYDRVIRESIEKRIRGRSRVGIIYSGGIDSLLIAYLAKQMGVPLTCYASGRDQGASDLDWARRTAGKFDFPIETRALSIDDIEELIPSIIQDIEDQSLNQVEVAIPIYASVRMAQEAGERVILTGQGADELFGGYPWYSNIVDREGYDEFVERSWEDACLLYKECLEREDKIAMAHSIELRVPFLDPQVFEFAFSIAPDLKIRRGRDAVRKWVHREYCRWLGIPDEIAFRKKEAAQHGANVHSVFEELAVKDDLNEKLMRNIGYDPEQTVTEKLGSSSRYGFKYGSRDLWKPLPHVQFYLDCRARDLGMLSPAARVHLEKARRQLSEVSTR
jgi:asparagine synthase (glutamine-hydrolysing)